MSKVFTFEESDILGNVVYVDTSQLVIEVLKGDEVNRISVGNLVAIETTKRHIQVIAIVDRITRKYSELFSQSEDDNDEIEDITTSSADYLKVNIVGKFSEVDGELKNVFKRGVDIFPSINGNCYLISGKNLQEFMGVLNSSSKTSVSLNLGKYMMDSNAQAILNGNRFFQRHAAILGSTGSGKSWCVANLLEKASKLKYPNLIVFDMHGEYASLCKDNTGFARYFKIAGPGDLETFDNNILFLPYWILNREEMLSIILDRSEDNAPNQASRFTLHVRNLKEKTLKESGQDDVIKTFTVDSPVPFSIKELIDELKADDTRRGQGKTGPVKGEWEGKLTRFISRLEAKISDKTYGFMFQPNCITNEYSWLAGQMNKLLGTEQGKGIKIIDFSEVPSDILPIITGTMARILFNTEFWMDEEKRTPFTLVCDEAHLYLPTIDDADVVQKQALYNFERIAKEGRKYGVSLLVISQRPADVSKTILSQCNNFIVLRLTNERDKGVIKNLLPDSLRGTVESISLLEVGEAFAIGDAILLPSRILLDKPAIKPLSATKDFWEEWDMNKPDENAISNAVEALRKQVKAL